MQLKYKHIVKEDWFLTQEEYDKLELEDQWEYESIDDELWEAPVMTEEEYRLINESIEENSDFWEKIQKDGSK